MIDSDLVPIKLCGLKSAVQWFAMTCSEHMLAQPPHLEYI